MDVYEIVKSIGSGSFGQVYIARNKKEDKQYVIKKIKTRDMQQKDRENTENEVRLLQKLRHTNIVAYKDSFLDKDQYLNIVMVYCEGGDIYNKIKAAKSKSFSEKTILDWFAQMSLALYYLHDKKILHRDLKTQNIFLKHGRVRLGDFGIAKVLDSTRDLANTCIGTPYYMSPELFKYKPYSYKSDIWALGCVLYEMCNQKHAFDAQSLNGLAVKIMKGNYHPISSNYSKPLRDLIIKMLSINPKQRPTILDVLNKSIVRKYVLGYMIEIFSGNFPESNDIDDIYIDSLKEQAQKLNLVQAIEQEIGSIQGLKNPNSIQSQKSLENRVESTIEQMYQNDKKPILDQQQLKKIKETRSKTKKELIQAEEEKQKLEDEVLALKKKQLKKQQQNSKLIGQSNSIKNLNNIKKKVPSVIPKKDDKLVKPDIPKIKPEQSNNNLINNLLNTPKNVINKQQGLEKDYKKVPSIAIIENKNKETPKIRISNENKEYELSKPKIQPVFQLNEEKQFMHQKDKILYEKQKKQKEEQDRWEKQFREISVQNFQAREQAIQKKNELYRSSNENMERKKFQIQEEKEMHDESFDEEVDPIYEAEQDEEDEDEYQIAQKIELMITQIQEKTQVIDELRDDLQRTKQIVLINTQKEVKNLYGDSDDSIEQYDKNAISSDSLPEFSDDFDSAYQNEVENQKTVVNNQIKLLRDRCEMGLGSVMFEQSYNFVKNNQMKLDDMRKNLLDILGDQNIGFWHLIDQIIFFENILQTIPEYFDTV